jgi:hypothetical protein
LAANARAFYGPLPPHYGGDPAAPSSYH